MATIQVNNWDEFVTAVGTSGATVECPANAIWDMNDIAPEGLTATITVNATSVNGNGLTIRNIYKNGGNVFNSSVGNHTISDINFENIYAIGNFWYASASNDNWYTHQFARCKFSGKIVNGAFIASNTGSEEYGNRWKLYTRLTSCSANLHFSGNSTLSTGDLYERDIYEAVPRQLRFVDSIIVISGKSTNTGTANQGQKGGYNAISLNNSLLTGNNPFINLQISQSYQATSTIASVIDLNCQEGQTIYRGSNTGTVSTTLINADKINGATVASQLIQVTDEQLKDAAYLESIGFPIGV